MPTTKVAITTLFRTSEFEARTEPMKISENAKYVMKPVFRPFEPNNCWLVSPPLISTTNTCQKTKPEINPSTTLYLLQPTLFRLLSIKARHMNPTGTTTSILMGLIGSSAHQGVTSRVARIKPQPMIRPKEFSSFSYTLQGY